MRNRAFDMSSEFYLFNNDVTQVISTQNNDTVNMNDYLGA